MKTVAIRLQKPQKGKEMKEKIVELIEACEAIENRMPEESHRIHVSDIAATLRGVLNPDPDDEETITLVDEIDFVIPRGLRELWGGE